MTGVGIWNCFILQCWNYTLFRAKSNPVSSLVKSKRLPTILTFETLTSTSKMVNCIFMGFYASEYPQKYQKTCSVKIKLKKSCLNEGLKMFPVLTSSAHFSALLAPLFSPSRLKGAGLVVGLDFLTGIPTCSFWSGRGWAWNILAWKKIKRKTHKIW